MNSMANKTVLVALALTLWGTSSMAATGELSPLPVSPAEQSDRHSVTAATAPVPLFALTRLDTQSLAAQAMTDQELKAVEGGKASNELLLVPTKGTTYKEVVIHLN
ncbi:MAG: hypothetical protein ND866_11620 [Pyrinomonadaceae bacterium]|nr:hypothetical protein [Pyrinomonadaceae bacterium]